MWARRASDKWNTQSSVGDVVHPINSEGAVQTRDGNLVNFLGPARPAGTSCSPARNKFLFL